MKKITFCIIIVALFIVMAIGFVSCGGSGGSKLTMIAVTPGSFVAATGTYSSLQYTATETLGDNSGSFNTTSIVNWTSSNTSLATIQSQVGLATINNVFPHSMSPQTAVITADDTVNSLISSVAIVIADPVTTDVTPTTPYMAVSTSNQFAAIATFPPPYSLSTQDLTSATGVLTWSIASDPAPTNTTVSTTGLVTAGPNPGTVVIQAQYSYFDGTNIHTCPAGTTTLTVKNATLVSIAVYPITPTYTLATSPPQHFTAQGTFSDASVTVNSGAPWIWASSNTAVATIDGAGLATFVATGTTTITATDPITGIAGSLLITVQ
jgi:hypothetical protein